MILGANAEIWADVSPMAVGVSLHTGKWASQNSICSMMVWGRTDMVMAPGKASFV